MSLDNPPLRQIFLDKNNIVDTNWQQWLSSVSEKTFQITYVSSAINVITTSLISKYYFNISGSSSNINFDFGSSYQYKSITYSGTSVVVNTTSASNVNLVLDTNLTCIEITCKKSFGKICYEIKKINNDSTVVFIYVTTNGNLLYTLPIGATAQIYLTDYKL